MRWFLLGLVVPALVLIVWLGNGSFKARYLTDLVIVSVIIAGLLKAFDSRSSLTVPS